VPKINLKRTRQPRIPTLAKKIYQDIYNTPRWKKLRNWYIRNHPLCEDCLEKNPQQTKVTQEIHHKIPWVNGSTPAEQESLAYDPDNLRALCIDCHKDKHSKFTCP